jgi:Protein of unknown function (DUF2786)
VSRRDSHRWRRRQSGLTLDVLANELFHGSGRHSEGEGWAVRHAQRLVAKASGGEAPFGQAADAALTGGLDATWRIGWQPMDVWEIFRRRLDDEVAEFIVGAIAAESVRYPAAASHPRWRAQLAELGATQWWPQDRPYAEVWAERAGIDTVAMLALVLEALAHLRVLPPEPELIPPPGSYSGPGPAPGSPRSSVSAEVDPKVLAKVRALLAKAESTEFPEEADAFFAKAQELMSRYSLERAVVEALDPAGRGMPVRTGGRRIWLDSPYLGPKSMLVNAVASANRCQAVFAKALGFVTVIGEETDTEIVEVLTTSLLVQAGRAMLAAGSQVDRRGQSRTKSFRQSFLISYAQRIGERLAEASERAETEVTESIGDGRLLPVLAAREEAVQQRVAELFPHLVSRRVSASNPAGWTAGRAAADLAVLDVHRSVRG